MAENNFLSEFLKLLKLLLKLDDPILEITGDWGSLFENLGTASKHPEVAQRNCQEMVLHVKSWRNMRERSARHGARANILRISAACTGTGGRKYFGNREIMDLQESKQRMMGGTNLGN